MPPRSLATLAQALAVAGSTDAAVSALGEALYDFDRVARVALIAIDQRRGMLRERKLATPTGVVIEQVNTTFDHFPMKTHQRIAAGGELVDLGDASDDYARLLQLPSLGEAGWLSVRGLQLDGALAAIVVVYEPRKLFGTRVIERFTAAISLFELAYLRFQERDARLEAVRTLEDVTQRVHEDYERKLRDLEGRLGAAANARAGGFDAERIVTLERELAHAKEDARRTLRRAEAVDATVGSAVGELEKAHIELHHRSEQLRQKTRTLYLIDRVLTLDCGSDDPRELAEALLALIGDDMQAHRCSLMLATPDGSALFLAAARGIAPGVTEGARVAIGEGVAGRVAATREPLLVQDVADGKHHPLRLDEYFTTGSFISFPLVHRGELVGVVNVANRAQHGVFVEDDVDRVRLLGLVIALVASKARLSEALFETLSVH